MATCSAKKQLKLPPNAASVNQNPDLRPSVSPCKTRTISGMMANGQQYAVPSSHRPPEGGLLLCQPSGGLFALWDAVLGYNKLVQHPSHRFRWPLSAGLSRTKILPAAIMGDFTLKATASAVYKSRIRTQTRQYHIDFKKPYRPTEDQTIPLQVACHTVWLGCPLGDKSSKINATPFTHTSSNAIRPP